MRPEKLKASSGALSTGTRPFPLNWHPPVPSQLAPARSLSTGTRPFPLNWHPPLPSQLAPAHFLGARSVWVPPSRPELYSAQTWNRPVSPDSTRQMSLKSARMANREASRATDKASFNFHRNFGRI